MKVFILTRKRLAVLGTALAVLLCLGIFRIAGGSDAVAVSTTERKIPIYNVDTDEKKVSISFDAAWGNEQTQSLLDTLDKYNVKATFFLVGDWVRNYPDDVKAIAEAGHDVGNHSNTHPYMTQISLDEMRKELETCNSDIESITGKRPTLFRPPYGDYDNNVVETVNSLGMYCVQWDVDSLDWKGLSAEEMCSRIKNNIQSGSIVLMHNGGENTPAALPSIIEAIQELGYEIVPISQLLPKGEYTTDHTGKMIVKDAQSGASSKAAESAVSEKTDSDSEKAKQTAAEVASSASDSSSRKSVSSSSAAATRSSTTSTNQGLKAELDNMVEGGSMKK